MSLTVTFDSIRVAIRSQLDAEGRTARGRHDESSVDDAAARGIAALHRLFRIKGGSDRFLSNTTISLIAGTATYSLPATFGHAVLVELTANGAKRYLQSYDHVDHPELTSPDIISTGIPVGYKITGSTIEFAPVPAQSQTVALWYVPTVAQPDGDPDQVIETVARFDDYAVLYAVGWLARKDRAWDLSQSCEQGMGAVARDLEWFMRHRDTNSTNRVRDVWGAQRRRIPGERL